MTMRVTGFASLKRRGYLSVALRTDEACRATVSAAGFRTVATQVVPGRATGREAPARAHGAAPHRRHRPHASTPPATPAA